MLICVVIILVNSYTIIIVIFFSFFLSLPVKKHKKIKKYTALLLQKAPDSPVQRLYVYDVYSLIIT